MMISRRRTMRGFTLIEMVAVISILAVLMGLCALTIQLLLRVSTDAQARRSTMAALGRLAEQFRADVHASDDVQIKAAAAGLRLNRGPKDVIEYTSHDGRIDRVESVAGQTGRRESYVLDRHDSVGFGRRDDGPRRFLALVVRHQSRSGPPGPPHPLEVLALVGKDRDRPAPAAPDGGPPR